MTYPKHKGLNVYKKIDTGVNRTALNGHFYVQNEEEKEKNVFRKYHKLTRRKAVKVRNSSHTLSRSKSKSLSRPRSKSRTRSNSSYGFFSAQSKSIPKSIITRYKRNERNYGYYN